MENYSFKQLFQIIFPKRKSISLKVNIIKRLTQLVNLFTNVLKESFILDQNLNRESFKNLNKKNILIIVYGDRLIGKSLCPTMLRLLNLEDSAELNYYFFNDPLSIVPKNFSKQINSDSKLLLLNYLRTGSLVRSFKNFWREIINRYQPNMIIGLMPNPILIGVSRELNIKIADIQHGVINLNHEWYMDRFYYKESPCYKFKPSYLLLWSKREVQIIREMIISSNDNFNNCKLVVIGPNINNENKQKRKNKILKNILITCSYNLKGFYNKEEYKLIDPYSIATQELFDWLLKIEGYIIRFRLHPLAFNKRDYINQTKGVNYLSKFNTKSLFHLSKNNSLSDDLNWSDFHITLKGSCTIDAYYAKKVTLFLCPASKRWWESSYNEYDGYVFKRYKYDSFEKFYYDALSFQKKQNKLEQRTEIIPDFLPKAIHKIVS